MGRAQGLFGQLAVGDVDASADDVLDRAVGAQECRVGPGDQPAASILGEPVVFVFVWELACSELLKHRPDGRDFLWDEE
jgi:hypothetical protein